MESTREHISILKVCGARKRMLLNKKAKKKKNENKNKKSNQPTNQPKNYEESS